MDTNIISAAVGAGGGTLLGSGLAGWLFKSYLAKVDRLIEKVIRLETTIKANESMRDDVKSHEIRLTLIEPKLERAHERLDRIDTSNH